MTSTYPQEPEERVSKKSLLVPPVDRMLGSREVLTRVKRPCDLFSYPREPGRNLEGIGEQRDGCEN